jgi:hypothetical protein
MRHRSFNDTSVLISSTNSSGDLAGFSSPKVTDPQRLKRRRMNANLLFMGVLRVILPSVG